MAAAEGFTFAGTDWNDGTNFDLEAFDPGVAPERRQWIQSADSDGALPLEDHYDNAVMTVTVRVLPQADMDTALTKIGTLVQALQEAKKQPLGSAAVWTPATSTKALTAYVLSGEVVDLPVSIESGYFVKSPILTMKLTRRPFLYGSEVTVGSQTSTLPAQSYVIADVTGDVPAEARLIVTDNATQSRRHVEWGLENRYYNASTSLIVESDDLVTSGFAGTQTTRSGAYDVGGGNTVVRGTLVTQPIAVCGTGVLAHVGSFRVKARVYGTNATQTYVRLTWQDGDGPFSSNPYVQPQASGNWCEVDLGVVTLTAKTLGTQKWSGRIDAYSSNSTVGSDTLDVDYLVLIPVAEGYGKARAIADYRVGVQIARDEFTGIAAATVLNARAAPTGGSWATSGSATDFAAADAPGSEETEARSTTSDGGVRYAILGTTNHTDTEAQVSWQITQPPGITGGRTVHYGGIIARWTDASNHLRVSVTDVTAGLHSLEVSKIIAGSLTSLASAPVVVSAATWYSTRVVVYTSGYGTAYLLDSSGATLESIAFYDPTLITAGTLANGEAGFFDYNGAAAPNTRYFDDFTVSTPASEQYVVASGQSCEIRHDAAIREDTTGTYWGNIPSYRGSRFYLPAAGPQDRDSRILVKARRADIDDAVDDQIADSTTVQCLYTPRFLVAPR